MRESIGLIPGVVILTAFSLAVLYWMYATIGVLSASQVEHRDLCASETKRYSGVALECVQVRD
jgi:hypothetical protein